MGKKISPMFKKEDEDDKKEFQEKIEEANFDKAINICSKASDEKGHYAKIQFNAPRYYFVALERIIATIPGLTPSDAHRTIYILGSQVVNKVLKERGKIGGELDDILMWVNSFEHKFKIDTVYASWNRTVEGFDKYLDQFKGNRRRLIHEIEKTKKEFKTISDGYWKDELSRKLENKIKEYLQSNNISMKEDGDDKNR